MDKIIVISTVIAILILGLSGWVYFTGDVIKGEEETIKIVASFPLQGPEVGNEVLNGVKLALEEVDYMAGGYNIELVAEDDGDENGAWVEDKERGIAQRAVDDEDVVAYIGAFDSGASKVSIPITNGGGLVQISPTNTWPGLTQPGFKSEEPGVFYPTGVRNYFRVVPTDALQGPSGALWAKELGAQNVYIFDNGDDYGVGIASLFEEIANEIGLNVIGRGTFTGVTLELELELERMRDLDIDLIYFGGTVPTGAGPLVGAIEDAGLDVKFMGPDAIMNTDFIDQAEGSAEGTHITTVGVSPKKMAEQNRNGREFYNNYMKRFGKEPVTFSAFSYEAAKVVLSAIERAGVKDRAVILEMVSQTANYDGLFGAWSFDQNGDTTLSVISGNIVKDGDFVFERLEQNNVYEIRLQIESLDNVA